MLDGLVTFGLPFISSFDFADQSFDAKPYNWTEYRLEASQVRSSADRIEGTADPSPVNTKFDDECEMRVAHL